MSPIQAGPLSAAYCAEVVLPLTINLRFQKSAHFNCGDSGIVFEMNAVVLNKYGDSSVMEFTTEYSKPILALGQVLVEVQYAGVNYIDTYQRSGLYKVASFPAVLGREGAGTIIEIADDVTQFSVGDRVIHFAGSGCYAKYCAIEASKCVSVPENLPMKIAACLPIQALTAHYLACSSYSIQKGDRVLIHAGAGGTGNLLIQMAKLRGAEVLTTVGTLEKSKLATMSGADHVIVYTQLNFYEEVMKFTDGRGVDCVYDSVGAATWEQSMKCVKKRGMLVLFGNASGKVPPIDPMMLTRAGSIYMTRPTQGDFISGDGEMLLRFHDVFQWIIEGKLTVRIGGEIPLEKAGQAHDLLTSRATVGKLLLVV